MRATLPPDWREMENALAAAWPVHWIENHDVFECRASPETSNRGNCVRLLTDQVDLEAFMPAARTFFERYDRPLQVAVPDPLVALDRDLASSGLTVEDPSLFMRRVVQSRAAPAIPDGVQVEMDGVAEARWLEAWARCAEPGPARDAFCSVLGRIRKPALFVALYDEAGAPLAVGSAVQRGRWRCFGNLATRRDARGKGLGGLVLHILAAQPASGAIHDALQVDRDGPAVGLYRKHGFQVAYAYHYRREMRQG